MQHRVRAVTLGLAFVIAAAVPAAAGGGWQGVRAATANFHSLTQAAKAGYSYEGEPCVEAPWGAMGIHAVNLGLASDLVVDPQRPEVLLYFPDGNGQLQLVAVEYFVIALANSSAGPIPWFGSTPPADGWFNPAPTVLGQTFEGPMSGHNPSMPWHYDLHAWLWADNPNGTFASFNPALDCP